MRLHNMMTVSLCVVAYNEERRLPALLRDLEAQTYPHELTELILVDGGSEDKTKQLMLDFARNAGSFCSARVIDNPKRIQAAGWNLAISKAKGDVIIRIDAHARIPSDFTAKNMALQEKGEYVTGGIRPCIADAPTALGETLLELENSPFGSGIGKSRRSRAAGYVKTVFHAAYRREVFDRAGGFDESLLRTEDNELHYRIRACGYRLYCDPDIVSYQYARGSLGKMIKQKYANGYWIGRTLWLCPGCISPYHLAPFLFLLAMAVTGILAAFSYWQFAALMWGAYLLFTLCAVFSAFRGKRANRLTFLMPLLFLLVHSAYGLGTLVGITRPIRRSGREKSERMGA